MHLETDFYTTHPLWKRFDMRVPLVRTKPMSSVFRTKNLETLSARAVTLHVVQTGDLEFDVQSGSNPETIYKVRLLEDRFDGFCDCPWGQRGGSFCSHVIAAIDFLNGPGSFLKEYGENSGNTNGVSQSA